MHNIHINPSTNNGFAYLWQGIKLLWHPQLRLFVLLPLLINILFFSVAIALLFSWAVGWVHAAQSALPSWLAWAASLVWLVLVILVLMAIFWGFNLLASLIAAPFNGLLSERTQAVLTNQAPSNSGWSDLLRLLPATLSREVSKLVYYLPRAFVLLILLFIPGINIIASWVWIAFIFWMMAIQYVDYPMDNNGISFTQMRKRLAKRKFLHLSFGAGVSLLLLVPFVNFFVMPVAVVSATLLWVKEHQEHQGDNVIEHQ